MMSSSQKLPFRWTPREQVLRTERRKDGHSSTRTYSFDVISDDSGTPKVVVRELLGDGNTYSNTDRFRALGILAASGISVARHLPLQITPDRTHVLVEYVDGKDLDTHPGSASPSTLLSHAKSLGSYYCRALLEEDFLLVDITHPSQYRVRDGIPMLVDMSLYLDPADEIRPYQAKHNLEEVTRLYRPLLPAAMGAELHETIESMKTDVLY